MKFFTQLFVIFILSSLQAWAAIPQEADIDWGVTKEIKNHVVLTLESEKGEVAYGPNFARSDKVLSENFSEIYLVKSQNLNDDEYYTLYITAFYADDDWRDYTSATAAGENAPLVLLSKTAPSCNDKATCKYEERLTVSLSFFDVVDAMTSSLDVILSGNRSDLIKIPGSYFRAVMQTIQAE